MKEVDFGGKKVWPNGPSSVTVNKQTIILTPTNMQDDLTITITVNDELANYYFRKPIYRTYIDKFAGHSYMIEAKLSGLSYSVSDVITIVYRDTRSGTDKAIDYGSIAGNIVGVTLTVAESSNPIGWGILILSNLPNVAKLGSEIQWLLDGGLPEEQDNNGVVGGER